MGPAMHCHTAAALQCVCLSQSHPTFLTRAGTLCNLAPPPHVIHIAQANNCRRSHQPACFHSAAKEDRGREEIYYQVEQIQLLGDDTALNGISLRCASVLPPNEETSINSTVGQWGTWGKVLQCKRGFLSGFALRVEEHQVLRDNTAANNIKFVCSDGNTIEGYGLSWGTYGEWSEKCRMGICGIQTRVQANQGPVRDDTSLNNVYFLCCNDPPKGVDQKTQ
uniref:Vitelline membrane outer layer protein 1 homolog n=1 Tax=Leptobrachium leishanense TaxID=445787 RepID=A0A8C5M6X5_9ANUR